MEYIDKGLNLYIDVTAACNASCPFCIAPTIGRKDGPGFIDGLRWALDFTCKHNGSVQITGGEPTLSRRLPMVLEEVRNRPFHRKVLNTNGCGITDASSIRDAGITHVNISRHHYDEHRNQEVMRIKPEMLSSYNQFITSVKEVQKAGIPVRVNCNLIAGYVDSFSEIKIFTEWCAACGVRNVAFSETFPLGLFDHQVEIDKGFGESHQVDLPSIVREADKVWTSSMEDKAKCFSVWGQSTWISSFTSGGHRRFWSVDGIEVSIKTLSGWSTDGSPMPPSYLKASDPELQDGKIYFAVVHPDGVVSASWDKRERILFTPRMSPLLQIKGDISNDKGVQHLPHRQA